MKLECFLGILDRVGSVKTSIYHAMVDIWTKTRHGFIVLFGLFTSKTLGFNFVRDLVS